MSTSSGYVDLQVNGFGGIDLNRDDLTAEDLHSVCQWLQEDGAGGFLPTIITGPIENMLTRLARIAQHCETDSLAKELILGVHIEGPFISAEPGYVGAHPADAVIPANVDDMKRLLEAAEGLTRIVTLAPECDPGMQVTRFLADQGIVVSAGHCDPSREELRAAIDAGLSMFTHLGNGCANLLARHDNIVERVLSLADQLWISFIADGAHVPFFALANYFKAAGIERCIVVSDAIAAAGLGPGRYSLGDQWIEVGEDHVPRSADRSHFVGSGTSIAMMADNLRTHLQLTEAEVQHLTTDGPTAILRGE